ncbi:Protein FAM73B, partial [Stegodyphus mimosarum]
MLKCQTNMEYIAKVHCIRVAFQLLFQQNEVRSWFVAIGNKILTGLMLRGEKDPKDCLLAYEDIIAYAKDKNNWPVMEDELLSRGVSIFILFIIKN